MIHPHLFVNLSSLEEKSLEELQETISDLSKKMNFVSRTQNHAMVQQLLSVIESYRIVYQKKVDESLKKQNINTAIDIK